jgi:hypothetical protein
MEQLRNKDVTEFDLEKIFTAITGLEKKFIDEAMNYMKIGMDEGEGSLFTVDLYTSAVVNRSISLMSGFLVLSKEFNYISSVPLIRLQVDNCLRYYASSLVADANEFFRIYLKGDYFIAHLKDRSGKRMTDTYLAEKLNELFPGILTLYKKTSGYIHLSNAHSFVHTNIVKDKERTIGTRIGRYDFYAIDQKVDFAYNMLKVSEILLTLVKYWTDEKGEIMSKSKPTN